MQLNEFNNPVRQFIVEAKVEKLTHLEHIEDLVYNEGYDGATAAVNFLNDVRRMLELGSGDKPVKITNKWDGSPAIVTGVDPEDGKFFIGTKSAFSIKVPKLIKSPKDITKFYKDKDPEFKEKLLGAFKYLKKLGITGVLQGDLLFLADSKAEDVIDGQAVVTFTPNTITYAAPIKSDVGQAILRAKLGIAFHTSYRGSSLPTMRATLGANIQGLNDTPDVWYDDSSYKDLTGRASLTPEENQHLLTSIDKLRNTIQKLAPAKFNIVVQNKEFARFIKPYINSLVWARKNITDPISFLKGYIKFYSTKVLGQENTPVGDELTATMKNRLYKIKQQEKFVEDNMNVMLGILAIYQQIINLKLMLINKLNSIDSMISTFRKEGAGYTVTNPEGFVVVGHYGTAVKLVDRIQFSSVNAARWKKS